MAIFGNKKTKEEKELERQEMLRVKEDKEMQAFMNRFALTEVDSSDLQNLRAVKGSLAGTGLMSFGNLLQGSKHTVTENYLSVLIEQNWMILKEMQRIRKALEDNEE